MPEKKEYWDVIVIGAGAAGVAVARVLENSGLSVRLLEKAERAGASWWMRYDGLRLNTTRWLSDLPLTRMPARYGRWPHRQDWAAYIEDYAATLGDTAFGVTAQRLNKKSAGWLVQTDIGAMSARFVVVATGHDRVPQIPKWSGVQSYSGTLIHSSQYGRAQDFRGQKILVVGTGNSGVEIATLLADEPSTQVSLSVRSPPLLLKREIGGIPVTVLAEIGRFLPDAVLDFVGLVKWQGMQFAPGDPAGGLVPDDGVSIGGNHQDFEFLGLLTLQHKRRISKGVGLDLGPLRDAFIQKTRFGQVHVRSVPRGRTPLTGFAKSR